MLTVGGWRQPPRPTVDTGPPAPSLLAIHVQYRPARSSPHLEPVPDSEIWPPRRVITFGHAYSVSFARALLLCGDSSPSLESIVRRTRTSGFMPRQWVRSPDDEPPRNSFGHSFARHLLVLVTDDQAPGYDADNLTPQADFSVFVFIVVAVCWSFGRERRAGWEARPGRGSDTKTNRAICETLHLPRHRARL